MGPSHPCLMFQNFQSINNKCHKFFQPDLTSEYIWITLSDNQWFDLLFSPESVQIQIKIKSQFEMDKIPLIVFHCLLLLLLY